MPRINEFFFWLSPIRREEDRERASFRDVNRDLDHNDASYTSVINSDVSDDRQSSGSFAKLAVTAFRESPSGSIALNIIVDDTPMSHWLYRADVSSRIRFNSASAELPARIYNDRVRDQRVA
jgi:hypothetical protein